MKQEALSFQGWSNSHEMKLLAIHQAYFFPYIGYFQLMNTVDEFIVGDNYEYTKKGWINRNRIVVNDKIVYITLPLKKGSDFLEIRDRVLADSWDKERKKMLNRISNSYRKSVSFNNTFPLVEQCLLFQENSLSRFIMNSLEMVKNYLEIKTPLIFSSQISDAYMKGTQKIVDICGKRESNVYVNAIGGTSLYNKEFFEKEGITLYFLKMKDSLKVSNLSIIDVLMNNTKEQVRGMLNKVVLI